MVYVKIQDGEVLAYPYSIAQLKLDNPNTSFPSPISENVLEDFDVYPVTIERPVERKAERLNILTDIKLKKAKEFVRQDRTEEAISTLDSILKINPDSTKAKHMLMEIKPAKKDYKKPRLNTPIKA